MQFLLTRFELDKLVDKDQLYEMEKKATGLARALSKTDGRGCVKDSPNLRGYCDDCPAHTGHGFDALCPIKGKNFSK